jgi:hypothetical protein
MKDFIAACTENRPPPRKYKASGIATDGSEYYPYIALNLHHHHLHRDGDPLLITQNIDDCIYGIGVATHAKYILGDKMAWLKEHVEIIDWTGCEWLKADVIAYEPDPDW